MHLWTGRNFILGDRIGQGKALMDDRKVTAIQDWEEPRTVQEVCNFLGLANYHNIFLESYSRVAAPLTELLKKNKKFTWYKCCNQAFVTHKELLTKTLILKVPNIEQYF